MRTRHLYAPQVALPRGARGLVLERTHEGALRLGAVGGAVAAAGLRAGDVVVAVGDERLVGYNHAKAVAPWLLAAVGHTSTEAEADGGAGEAAAAEADGGGSEEGEGAPLRITVCRTAEEDKRTKTWREQVAAQIGGGGGGGGGGAPEGAAGSKTSQRAAHESWKERAEHSIFDTVLPSRSMHGKSSEDSPAWAKDSPNAVRTWKERAGRHSGGDHWHWGDVTRSLLVSLGERARGVSSDVVDASTAEADMAGEIGKRSKVVKQWRRRWFALKDDTLYWAHSSTEAPHGSLSLRGATICTDDFATGQAYSIIIESPTRGKDGPLFLSALSLRDRDAWTAAFTNVDRCVYRAAIEDETVDIID